jgi:LmbE family N-acetylglucosaminyl deacetylase
MRALLLAAHNDDEALFAAYTCLKYKPRIVICYRSMIQAQYGVTAVEREDETNLVAQLFGCGWDQLLFPDDGDGDIHALTRWLEGYSEFVEDPEIVFAPTYEEGGHEQHNIVSLAGRDVFGDRVHFYYTYTRNGRSREGMLVEPDDFDWIRLKMQALACYRSQFRVKDCRPWFYDLLDLREWIAT